MEQSLLKIGITQGDINGIGLEVILKTFADNRMLESCTPILFASPKAVGYYKKQLELDHLNINLIKQPSEANPKRLNVIAPTNDEPRVDSGVASTETGKAAADALEAATWSLKKGEIDALVTAPINKNTIQSESFQFSGHTEYLEANGDGSKSLMLLTAGTVRIALVTNHTPITDVASAISEERILEKLHILKKSLQQDFRIIAPRIAVLALNPHAGDNGLLGKEEQTIISPAISKANEEGIICVGPLSADGFFGSGNYKKYDAVLAMYHDQGLAPFKALFMEEGVNYTAGLPFVRTSPAHGTAYDLAGKKMADEASFRQAVYTACDIVSNRAFHKEMWKNPLVTEGK